jgi:hypothetical protein
VLLLRRCHSGKERQSNRIVKVAIRHWEGVTFGYGGFGPIRQTVQGLLVHRNGNASSAQLFYTGIAVNRGIFRQGNRENVPRVNDAIGAGIW